MEKGECGFSPKFLELLARALINREIELEDLPAVLLNPVSRKVRELQGAAPTLRPNELGAENEW